MTRKRTISPLLFIYFSTFILEIILKNIDQISPLSLLSNATWFIYNSILLKIYLLIFILVPFLANYHQDLYVIKLKFFDLILILFDINKLLTIYDQYTSIHINLAFIFCLIRLFSKFNFLSRKYSSNQSAKQIVYMIDFALLILIHIVLIRHTNVNLFDFIRRVILWIIIIQFNDLFNSYSSQKLSSSDKIYKQCISIICIILLIFSFDWKYFSIFRFIINLILFISIYFDTKSCLNQRTCTICYDEKEWYEFDQCMIHSCQHKIRFVCDKCLLKYVCTAIELTFRDDLLCQEEECHVRFDYDTVKNILLLAYDEQLIERYDRYVLHRQLEQMDEFIWCSNPLCSVGQLNEGGKSNVIVRCFNCQQRTCFTHRIIWHEGMTCEEYDANADPIYELSRRWIVANSKKCPNCPYEIEKNDGCDHMKCIKCKHEFCWSCLADYEPIRRQGNHLHKDTCKHYAAYDIK